MEKKYYTLEEANAALAEVRTMAGEIRKAEAVRQEKQKSHSEVMLVIAQNGGNFSNARFAQLTKALERSTRHLQRLIDELQNKFRCEIKGLQPLLVDFYSLREGREVYLCWKEGEEEITHWHDLDSGFAGRRPL